MNTVRAEDSPDSEKVISPFAETEARVLQRKPRRRMLLWALCAAVILMLTGAAAAFFLVRYLDDPYRTLQPFPVSKYFDDYQALSGAKYKADFRVEADLGWKDGAGRLMLFSTAEDSRPIAVLIPATVASGIYFTKGQTYTAEIEVKEGGLIYANSFQKN